MRKELYIILFWSVCFVYSNAQNASPVKVWEYCPAPGQFVHELPLYESGDDAEIMAGKCLENLQSLKPVSLGGFGGFITLGFDHPILNLSAQKDFAVWGNAFEGSAEPGIVMVSSDANGDGLPNDEWYELNGSESENVATIHEYEITYTRPSQKDEDVSWSDNQGRIGAIEYMGGEKGTHSHPHYPEWASGNTLSFRGTCLPDNGKWDKEKKMWVMKSYAYGYTDNYPNSNKEGCSFDIDWATDQNGNPISLESIDFIRIYTGVNQQIPSGGVGELSTEVSGAEDLHPHAANLTTLQMPDHTAVYYSKESLIMKNTGEGNVLIYDWKGSIIFRFYMDIPSGSQPVTLQKGFYLVRCPIGIFKLGI